MSWLERITSRRETPEPLPQPGPRDIQIATAALLIEVSGADDRVEETESAAIQRALGTAFGLAPEELASLLEAAERRTGEAVSLYELTRLLDRAFTADQKATVIELLFRVAFADAFLAGEEEHLIRKVATLLHVEHPAFLAARARAKE